MGDDVGVLVPIVAILAIFGLPMCYAICNRYYAHQEHLEMIRHGVVPPDGPKGTWGRPQSPDPRQVAGPWATEAAVQYQAGMMLRKGITVGMVGLALLIGLSFIDPGHPGPWLLGGLIPLAIGAAQVVIAVLSGARLPDLGRVAPPPPPPRDFAGGPPGYRPGPTVQIESPKPPDRV